MKKLLLLAAMTALLTGCSSGSSETFLRSLLDSDSQLSDDADYINNTIVRIDGGQMGSI